MIEPKFSPKREKNSANREIDKKRRRFLRKRKIFQDSEIRFQFHVSRGGKRYPKRPKSSLCSLESYDHKGGVEIISL